MDELSQKWEDLSDIAQATIIELIAGKHQGNVFSSLMANFDTAREALETSATSSGSAMKEHAKWSDSLEARLNKLKSTWQSLSQSFMSSGFLKAGISGITGFVDAIDGLIDKFGTLPTLLGTFAAGLSLFKNKGIFTFDKDTKSIQTFGVELSNLGKTYTSLQSNIKDYNSLSNKQQADFANYIGKSNNSLGQYLTGLNGAKASMGGYISSLVGAKVATFALQAATMALNAALTMGISFLISAAIKAFDEWYVSAEELAEKVDEVTSKYKEQHDSLMKLKRDYDTTNESSMISKYAELSKGVDAFGKNLSLTADEYSEYQNIVGTIADQIPSLVSGYDSQGNAILSCAGNVEQLTAAYEDLIHAQNNEILTKAGDINKDFENVVKDTEHNTKGWFGWNWTKELDLGGAKLSSDAAKIYKDILNSTDAVSEFKKALTADEYGSETFLEGLDVKALSDLLETAGFEKDGSWLSGESSQAHVERAFKENKAVVKKVLDQYYADLETEVEGKKSIAEAALSEAFDISDSIYSGMSDTMKNIAKQTVGGFDFEFFADLDEKGIGVEEYVNKMLDQLNALSDTDSTAIETAFNLKTQFNGGEISYGEYVDGLESTGNLVDNLVSSGALDQEVGTQIKLSIGLNEDGLVENYKALSNRLKETGLSQIDAEGLLDNLSSEELSVLTKIIPEIDANATREQIEAAIDREMVVSGLVFDLNLEVEAAGIESLNTALSETVTATGLSSESIAALKSRYSDLESQGYDLSSMFEETSHGIHLNRNELSKFENELSKQKLTEVNNDLERMKAEYDKLGEAIKTAGSDAEKSELFSERQSLAQKISECATLASQYQGLTSAYNQWLTTEEAGNERDMYENVLTGFETVKDELSRGWADDGTVKFLEMLTGRTDLAGKSGKELKEIYNGLDDTIKNTTHSIRDFFTVDDEGNSTSKGVYNFLDAVGQLEEEAFGGKDVVKRDGKGNVIGFDFELAGGDAAVAEALGVSEELVQIMVRAADDAGFVVSMDGTYRQLADLQNEAKTAADTLKELGKTDFDFDFNTSNVKDLTTQLGEAKKILKDESFWNEDGTFNFDAKGATEAMQVVSTLQAKIDNLTKEKYGIGLTVEDKEFEEPLENLQNYGEKVATLNQLELNPKANAEEIEKLNGELDGIAEYFANLDGETKVKLGFEADDGIGEVKSKIESGEVKIPTTLDIQTNMDKNLSDLRDLALLNSGLLSEEQEKTIKIRLGIEVEPDEEANSKVQESVDKVVEGVNNGTTTVEPNFEIKPASEVTISDTFEGEVKTGAEGRLNGMGVDVDANVNVDAEVDASKAEEKTKEKTKEAVGDGETIETTANVTVDPEVDSTATISQIAEDLEKIESKSVTVNVTANLDGNINEATDIDKIADFAEGAKSLEGVESSYVSVSANFSGNIGEIDGIDKLVDFADGAKSLDGVESSNVSVTATLTANFNGGDLDSLSKFADSASKLEGVKNSDVKVVANLDSTIEGNLDDLARFAEQAKELQGVKSSDVSLTVELNTTFNDANFDDLAKFVDSASKLEGVKGSKVSVSANLDGNLDGKAELLNYLSEFAEGAKALQGVKGSDVAVVANLESNLDSSVDNLTKFAEGAKALQGVKSSDVTVTANVAGNLDDGSISRLNNLTSILPSLKSNSSINVSVKASIDSGAINNAIALLTQVANSGVFKDYNANVTATVNYAKGNQDLPEDKDAKVNYNLGTQANPENKTAKVNYSLGAQESPKEKTVYVNYVEKGTAAGTAYADGTAGHAFARGDWGIKGNGVALGGELGRELVVRDGKFFTIGDDGAEFFRYKKNDIIFNAAQTESLFKYGGIKGANPRGKMLASGTAFFKGSAFAGGSRGSGGGFWTNEATGKTYGKSSSSSSDSKNKFEETIDWIEIAIDRIERAIDQLDTKANSIYRTWSERNKNLAEEISKVEDEIELQQAAYEEYMEAAAGVGLSEEWAEKVRNGTIDIETITDETLAEKIKDYQEWYEKALECQDAILELKETEAELYAQRVENAAAQYEGVLGVIEHEKNMLEEHISQSEAQGWIVSGEYYEALMNNERETIAGLENQRAEMIAAFNEAMESGTIAVGSEAYYDMINNIDGVTLAIEESKTAMLEYEQTIQQLSWEVFDILQDKISAITEESDFLINLFSNDKLYDDKGQLTAEGMATMGLHGQNYNVYMAQADNYAQEISRLNKEIEKDPYDQDLINRRDELLALQRESILAAEEEKQAIVDMVRQGIELELDALQERIDKYNEAIESQKDLYDYQKKVKEQTQEIASLEKQIAAYRGDTSEEARAKIQELKVSLEEAKTNLEETEYDRYISDQQKLLDELYLEYEEILNIRLDNVDALISDAITEINDNATTISTAIANGAESVGYTLSDSMKTIWNDSTSGINGVITTYGEKFSNAQTTTNNALNIINANLQSVITQLNEIAKTNVESASTSSAASNYTSSKSSSTKNSTSTKPTIKKSSSGGDGKPKIGDRVKYVSGQYYYDSQGKKPLGSYKQGEYVYITNINKKDWATHGYHISTGNKLGKGDLGWLKLNQISGYATGAKKISSDNIAWTQENGQEFIVRPSDGAILTPIAKDDTILTSTASNNIWNMANSPADFIKDNLNLGSTSVPNNSNVQNNYTQYLDKVVFSMPNVTNYEQFLSALQRDKRFENLVLSMTIDQIAGKSSLGKSKAIK